MTRWRGQGVDRHGLWKGDHLAAVEVVLALKAGCEGHHTGRTGALAPRRKASEGVARANEEVHRSTSADEAQNWTETFSRSMPTTSNRVRSLQDFTPATMLIGMVSMAVLKLVALAL